MNSDLINSALAHNAAKDLVGHLRKLLESKNPLIRQVIINVMPIATDTATELDRIRLAIEETELLARAIPEDTVDTIIRAESFIAGFESDPDQKGVPQLLEDLRHVIDGAAAQC